MLQFRQSIITLGESSPGLRSVTKGNTLEILGNCPYNIKRQGNFIKIEFVFDTRRNNRHLIVLTDTSPCPFNIEDDKIIVEFERKSIPKKLELQWLEEVNEDVPDVFFSEVKAVENDVYFDCHKTSNNRTQVQLIYDLSPLARTKYIKLVPKAPLNYKQLKVYKGNDLVWQGTNLVDVKVPFEFNQAKLCYNNSIIYLDWYNLRNERLTEVFDVEFIKQNDPDQNIQLPIISLDRCYEDLIHGFKVITDTVQRVTSFKANGELNDIGFYLNLRFVAAKPKGLIVDKVLVGGNLLHNRTQVYDIQEGLYNVYVSPRIIDSENRTEVELFMKYDFGSEIVTQRIELTNLLYK